MPHFIRLFVLIAVFSFGAAHTVAEDYAAAIEGLEKKEGLAPLYIDHKKGRALLELDGAGEQDVLARFIYVSSLTAGLGSNPVGLDRSSPRSSRIIQFRRAGNRVLAVVENSRFRASADNPAEKNAVKTSFAESIIWSTKIVAENAESRKVLIDLSEFLTLDMVGVSARLAQRGQGAFKRDPKRSYLQTSEVHNFPMNMEFDAHVTFSGAKPGAEVRATTPVPQAITLVMHTGFMKLPEGGYEIRRDDERAGLTGAAHVDMSAPLSGDTVVRLARRFRLQKDDDGNVIKPIVFYIDNAAPEPIRSALLDGARWWSSAFEKAGFPGGYRAEILPEGVHPLDARYNVVNWVHRATRGWSYGASIDDPRTGEILRGAVLLGSLRVRQDIKIFEALAGASKTGTGAADDPVELALARIRQLAAHEIGHSLGFAHNMAASTYGTRASVMDYPAPDVRLQQNSQLDFSNVYGVGVGAWDDWIVKFLYGKYEGDQQSAQAALVAEADAAGLLFVSDRDSRSVGTGHFKGALWDTGEDAVESLKNTLAVRRMALNKFGAGNLRAGEPYKALQTKIVPLYLYHRYQMQAAAKYLGGLDYVYRHQGDNRPAPKVVSQAQQKEAFEALLITLTPATLDLPSSVLRDLSPLGSASGDPQFGREVFGSPGRPMFDHTGAAAVAADLAFDALLHPSRMLRLYEQGVRDPENLTLAGVLSRLVGEVVRIPDGETDRHTELRKVVVGGLTERMIKLSHSASLTLPLRVEVQAAITTIRALVGNYEKEDALFAVELRRRIDTAGARARTPAVKEPKRPATPPGSPIGAMSGENCWHCATGF